MTSNLPASARKLFVSQSKIEIDCEFEDDVTALEVVVGEGKVTALGKVVGVVEGDIHHNSLAIAMGAKATGRCRQNEARAWSYVKSNAA